MPNEVKTGVNPVNEITFGICITGRPSAEELSTATYTTVSDAESLSISIDGGVEEWNPMEAGGWRRALMTSKGMTISMGGKRNYGDPGNDYVASLAMKNGQDCNSAMQIKFPNGDKLIIPCVINTTSLGGDSTATDALEWEVVSDGKPIYVDYQSA